MKSTASPPQPMLGELEAALAASDRVGARRVLQLALTHQTITEAVEGLVVPALENMGLRWEAGRLALSQIYMGGRICEELVDSLLPVSGPVQKDQPRMAIAVLEDHHMLGKRMVCSQLRASGFELADYGRVEVHPLVERVRQDQISILLISTLMLPSALRVRDVREGLTSAGWTGRIVVGGAPFRIDPQLWQEVGADATSSSASGAVALVRSLAGGGSFSP